MLPLFLDLKGKLGVVVGGGPVGRRKATALLEAGGGVRLVCPQPRPATIEAPFLEWLEEPYQARHLEGAILVIAAATPEVNRQVTADARSRGLLVNVASEPETGDFSMAATFRRGDFTLAIGTGGAAPALAREVRLLLEAQFDEAYGKWVEILAWLRPQVAACITDPGLHKKTWDRLCRAEWLDHLRRENFEEVRAAMLLEVRKMAAKGEERL